MREPVKGKTEAGRRREERARATRQRIIEAALRLFVERGYVAATVERLAAAAGVAPATVYQAFGAKVGVLSAALEVAIAGDVAPVAIIERDWVAEAGRERDGRRRLQLVVEGACRIAARTAPVKEVIRDAAASDPEARDLIRVDHERRRQTQEYLVGVAVDDTDLAPGVDRGRVVDTFFALVNSSTYDLLVVRQGWTIEEWQAWVVDIIERACLDPSP